LGRTTHASEASAPDALPPIDAAVDTCVTALRLIDRLGPWCAARGPAFSGAYVNVFCLSSAFITPWLDLDMLHLASRIWSWITALDDTVDGSSSDVDGVLDECLSAARGGPPRADPGADPVAAALAEIRAELATRPGFAALEPHWRDATERLVAGMRYEAETSRAMASGAPPPSLAGYLGHALYTVGIPMYVVSLWSAMDEVPVAALMPALRDAAVAVRLANDLRGHAREGGEGALNALRLGVTQERARQLVGDRLASTAERLAPHLAGGLPAAVAIDRMATWGTRIYQRIDFRAPSGHDAGRDDWQFQEWLGAA
jgi:Terpene synthase family 2, C-terminal metal binding